jgi:SAM-dependent methyltransferase
MDNYRKETADRVRSLIAAHDMDYQRRMNHEPARSSQCMRLHEVPAIFHYWANTHLAPHKFQQFGITDTEQFFFLYAKKYHERFPERNISLLSLGTGSNDMEVRLARRLLDNNISEFRIDCVDVTAALSGNALEYSANPYLAEHVFIQAGGIEGWLPDSPCDIVLCNQSLHHVPELEYLFSMIKASLVDEGYLLVSDAIGKNGHQLWPEALGIVDEFRRQLPARYKYNHVLNRLELRYTNHDYSTGTLEGVRSQDILPLLHALFNFELFIPFANVVPVFIDRPFGYNFSADSAWEQDFIDRVHKRDEQGILSGELKPAQMLAVLCKEQVQMQLVDPRLTPEFCIRHASYN